LSLAYGLVSVHKRVNYNTNEVLTSKHECVMDLFACNLHTLKRLTNCRINTTYCSRHSSRRHFLSYI